MDEILRVVLFTLTRLDARSLLEIMVVAAGAYWLMSMVQGTTAEMIIRGLVILLVVASMLSRFLDLPVMSWLLRNSVPALLVAIPILFGPELRRALEQLGHAGGGFRTSVQPGASTATVEAVAETCQRLARSRWGALIVIERETALGEYVERGVALDAGISPSLLESLFFPNSPLHDGAVVVRGDRIIAARCILPFSDLRALKTRLGARHQAAVGITESTDAVSVVVSEETGAVSVAHKGRLNRDLDETKLKRILSVLCRTPSPESRRKVEWLKALVPSKVASTLTRR